MPAPLVVSQGGVNNTGKEPVRGGRRSCGMCDRLCPVCVPTGDLRKNPLHWNQFSERYGIFFVIKHGFDLLYHFIHPGHGFLSPYAGFAEHVSAGEVI
jgi:hypothetical protein